MYGAGVQTYRVTLRHLARLWTPPAALADVESAEYVFYLCGLLFLMESYHAIGYTLRQLRRFGAEASLRGRTMIGGIVREMGERREDDTQPAVPEKRAAGSRDSCTAAAAEGRLERDAEEGDVADHNFDSAPGSPVQATSRDDVDGDGDRASPGGSSPSSRFAWYRNVVWRSVTGMPRTASSAESHSEGDATRTHTGGQPSRYDSSASNTVLHERAETEPMGAGSGEGAMPLSHHGAAAAAADNADGDVLPASNLPTQRGVSYASYGAATATMGVPSVHGIEEVEGDLDEEEQTWEATPEMLKHYWKQLERSILTAPRHAPLRLWRSLPSAMLESEPDVAGVQAWCDDLVHRALHHGAPAPTWSSWLASMLQSEAAAAAAAAATAAGEGAVAAHGGGSGAAAGACGRVQRPVFRVPAGGSFTYAVKPDLADFFADEVTEADEEDDEGDEEEPEDEGVALAAEMPGNAEGRGDGAAPRSAASSRDEAVAAAEQGRRGHDAGDVLQSSPLGDAPHETSPADAAAGSASGGGGGGRAGLTSPRKRRYALKWEALFFVWFNVVEVSISSREIRALLLKASPPAFLSPAMTHDGDPTDLDVASTNLSLLWLWSTVQRVFETLVINEDVEKCDDDIEELATYTMPLYNKCIARWPAPAAMASTSMRAMESGLVGLVCGAQAAWISLNTVLRKLLSLRRQLYVRNTWSLARYMYSSSKAKIMSAALITVMMTLSSRVSAAGRVVRERIASYVEKGDTAGSGSDSGGGSGAEASSGLTPRYVAALLAFELIRMAVQYVISNVTSEFIVLTASQRREIVKMQLYEALSHTQLSFYEQHTYEEVEEIIYYVSDMEGIDVQLHQFLFDAINVFVALRDALRPFTYRSMLVAAVVSLTPYALRRTATAVENHYLLLQREGYLPSAAYAFEDEMQGDDDGNVLREGAMLRGDEIIAAIPQLRPYGADVRLVRWWNRHQQRRQHIQTSHRTRGGAAAAAAAAPGGERSAGRSRASSPRRVAGGAMTTAAASPVGSPRQAPSTGRRRAGAEDALGEEPLTWSDRVRDVLGAWVTDEDISLVRSALFALLQLPHGKLLPGTGKAVLDLTEWLLPMVASAYGRVWCGQPGLDGFQLLEGMQAIESAVDTVVEAFDTAEMVGYNAYKASMLERLLQPTQWEVISREEEAYVANFTVSAAAMREAADARQACGARALTTKAPAASVAPAGLTRGVTASIAEARSSSFYRRQYLRCIEVRNVRLRYLTPQQQQQLQQRQQQQQQQRSITRDRRGSRGVSATPSSSSNPSGGSGSTQPTARTLGNGSEDEERAMNEADEAEMEDEDAAVMALGPAAASFSGDIVIWSPSARRGRFVCVTGPNGGGKTAFVNLLLALYVHASGFVLSSAAASPHTGQIGNGTVTFCFTPRTQTRKPRRGALLSRTHTGGAAALRTGRSMRSSASPNPEAAHEHQPPPPPLQRTMTAAGLGDITSTRTSALPTARSMGAASFSCPDLSPDGEGEEGPVSSSRRHRPRHAVRDDDGDADTRVDLRAIPADVLRRHIFSYVPETPTLFPGATVAQNISLAGYVSVATDHVMRRVLQCAELAQCDFVHKLPLGLLTRVSDSAGNTWTTFGQYSAGGGVNSNVTRLSADHAKRLMLARAYFHGGEVLLLDEPTKEIEEEATALKMAEGWRRLLDRGYLGGVVCATMDETLLCIADEVIYLP